MSAPPLPGPPDPATGATATLRLLAGVVLLAVGLATALFGFTRLFAVLDAGGYGTPAMRTALVLLGASGACLAAAIATLIWHVSQRYER